MHPANALRSGDRLRIYWHAETSGTTSALRPARALTISEEEEYTSSAADGTVVPLSNELFTVREKRKRNAVSVLPGRKSFASSSKACVTSLLESTDSQVLFQRDSKPLSPQKAERKG